jgi:hypothetical protein
MGVAGRRADQAVGRDQRPRPDRAGEQATPLDAATFRIEPQHEAFFRARIECLAVERERRRNAARARAPEDPPVPEPDGVHTAVRLRFGADVQPVLVEQRAGADRPVEPRAPQHVAAGPVDEHDVAVGRANRDDGLAERRAAANGAADGDVPDGSGIVVQGLPGRRVVSRGAEVGRPG